MNESCRGTDRSRFVRPNIKGTLLDSSFLVKFPAKVLFIKVVHLIFDHWLVCPNIYPVKLINLRLCIKPTQTLTMKLHTVATRVRSCMYPLVAICYPRTNLASRLKLFLYKLTCFDEGLCISLV